MKLKALRRTISPWETTNAIYTEPEGGFQLRTMPRDMLKGERLTAAAVIPGGTVKDIWSSQNKPSECLLSLGKLGGLWIKINNKNSWTLPSLFCFSKMHLFCPWATTKHAGGCCELNFIHKCNFLMKKLGCWIKNNQCYKELTCA